VRAHASAASSFKKRRRETPARNTGDIYRAPVEDGARLLPALAITGAG